MLVVRGILDDYITLCKTIGIKGLCAQSKLSMKIMNEIRYHDIDRLNCIEVLKLGRGLKSIKKKINNHIDVMVKKLEDLQC